MVRIIRTNSAGTGAHVVDRYTHEVPSVVEDVPHAHGMAEHPERLYYYFSNEMHRMIDVVGAMDDPQWQILAAWVRGEWTGRRCEA